MKWPLLFLVVACGIAAAREDRTEPVSQNVNARYTVESVQLGSPALQRLSRSLREEIDGLVGQKFDPALVVELAGKIRSEIHKRVTHKIERGDSPDNVRVVYLTSERPVEDGTEVTKVRYHQKQGWTGGFEAGLNFGRTRVEAGVQSDADELLERYAGINAGFSRPIGEHLRAQFSFEAFHQQWNETTIDALAERPDVPGIYRERYHMKPGLTVVAAPGLTLTGSVSIQHFETQFPAAMIQAANALETTLRYSTRWRESGSHGQELDAGYTLRAATNFLGTDYVYTKHAVHADYALRHDHHLVRLSMLAGHLNGEAPLFDRFSLGNTRTLRGWNKFDIAPLGGDRVMHGSASYRYRAIGVFYDAGSVWDHGKESEDRHSVGVTLALGALRDGPYLTLAFPLRNGAILPLFMMGMNF